ncbi:MAG: hypothetical protein RJA57_971 [Bacteroidota bacterium]|jgi:glutathione peroxidase
MQKLKIILLVVGFSVVAFAGCVAWVNRNQPTMTYRQKILRTLYPALMWVTDRFGSTRLINDRQVQPPASFYDLRMQTTDGTEWSLDTFRGKKVLIVNTASDCGYTAQYDALQKLYEQYGDRLVILAFPANDFKQQEKGSDADIAGFCRRNYGVTFPLAKKSVVIRSSQQHPVFQWLTDASRNGWCDKAPKWNFSKYLVDEKGMLVGYFDPSISPLSRSITERIQ